MLSFEESTYAFDATLRLEPRSRRVVPARVAARGVCRRGRPAAPRPRGGARCTAPNRLLRHRLADPGARACLATGYPRPHLPVCGAHAPAPRAHDAECTTAAAGTAGVAGGDAVAAASAAQCHARPALYRHLRAGLQWHHPYLAYRPALRGGAPRERRTQSPESELPLRGHSDMVAAAYAAGPADPHGQSSADTVSDAGESPSGYLRGDRHLRRKSLLPRLCRHPAHL